MIKNGWIENSIGHKIHYVNDKVHRDNEPAIIMKNGSKFWFKNGLCHREDGPAMEYINGGKEWYYHGKNLRCLCKEDFLRLMNLKSFW